MNQIIESYKDAWVNWKNFSGRTRRSGYWYAVLANVIVAFVLGLLGGIVDFLTILSTVYGIAFLVPGIALCIRRLHDVGKSGWWYFIALVPLVGAILLLVWFCQDSQPDNQYGPSPKGYGAPAGYAAAPQQGYQSSQNNSNGPEL